MNINSKILASIGLTAVATLGAVYTAIALHKKKEQDEKFRMALDSEDDIFEECFGNETEFNDTGMGFSDAGTGFGNEETESTDNNCKCKSCHNTCCPYSVDNDTETDSDTSDAEDTEDTEPDFSDDDLVD